MTGELEQAGENRCAGLALVREHRETEGAPERRTRRWIALVRRRDNGTWAIPGGRRNAGEDAVDAMRRELLEDAGVDTAGIPIRVLLRNILVDDPRNTTGHWVSTTLGLARVSTDYPLVAGKEEIDARWFPIGIRVVELLEHMRDTAVGTLYQPHLKLVARTVRELALLDKIAYYFDLHIGSDLLKTGVPAEEVARQREVYTREVRDLPAVLHAIIGTGD